MKNYIKNTMSKIEIENRHRAPPSLANTIILAPPPSHHRETNSGTALETSSSLAKGDVSSLAKADDPSCFCIHINKKLCKSSSLDSEDYEM